jgi:hypothetical protein
VMRHDMEALIALSSIAASPDATVGVSVPP